MRRRRYYHYSSTSLRQDKLSNSFCSLEKPIFVRRLTKRLSTNLHIYPPLGFNGVRTMLPQYRSNRREKPFQMKDMVFIVEVCIIVGRHVIEAD